MNLSHSGQRSEDKTRHLRGMVLWFLEMLLPSGGSRWYSCYVRRSTRGAADRFIQFNHLQTPPLPVAMLPLSSIKGVWLNTCVHWKNNCVFRRTERRDKPFTYEHSITFLWLFKMRLFSHVILLRLYKNRQRFRPLYISLNFTDLENM